MCRAAGRRPVPQRRPEPQAHHLRRRRAVSSPAGQSSPDCTLWVGAQGDGVAGPCDRLGVAAAGARDQSTRTALRDHRGDRQVLATRAPGVAKRTLRGSLSHERGSVDMRKGWVGFGVRRSRARAAPQQPLYGLCPSSGGVMWHPGDARRWGSIRTRRAQQQLSRVVRDRDTRVATTTG